MPEPRKPFGAMRVWASAAFLLSVSALSYPVTAPGDASRNVTVSDIREKETGGRISGDVRLSGRVRVTGDILVLPGATLSIEPGTVLTFDTSESSKVDPEYFHGGTEIVVRGALRAKGARFLFSGRGGGIAVDGGRAELEDCVVSGAEAGIAVHRGGTVAAAGTVTVSDCRVGVAMFPGGGGGWRGGGEVLLVKNAVGAVRFPGAQVLPASFRFAQSEEADALSWGDGTYRLEDRTTRPSPSPGALRMGDTFLDRSRSLSGDVVIDGVVRVAPGAVLAIAPGSRIFFAFRDTDGDGIGESGIFLQGTLDARGTGENPIGFYPLDGAGPGRWDAINFMASDIKVNVLENVTIAGGYRGLHAHFSRLRGKGIRISGCYRGIQFQESEVDLSDVEVSDSLSGLRCRDSDVRIDGIRLRDTASGGNFFRSKVRLLSPDVLRTGWYGLRLRESRVEIAGGTVREALVGVSVQEGRVEAEDLHVDSAGLAGAALQDGDVKMKNCRITACLLDGVSATAARASISGGAITGYGRHAVKLAGHADVVLRGVERAGRDAANPIHDGKVAPGLGVVRIE